MEGGCTAVDVTDAAGEAGSRKYAARAKSDGTPVGKNGGTLRDFVQREAKPNCYYRTGPSRAASSQPVSRSSQS